jgi:broad specificity phosphatase PhoE
MTLYLARHFPTSHNSDDPSKERIRGWGDQGVSAEGKAMVPAAVDALRETPPRVIFTSDLPRAKETAELMAKELGNVPVVASKELRTWNVGDITGQPVSDAKPQLDELQHTKRLKAAPNGESYQDFFDRWGDTFARLRKLGRDQDVLAVLHGRQVYSAPNHVSGKGPAGIPTHGAPDPGDILAVNETGKRLDYVHRSGAAAKVTA